MNHSINQLELKSLLSWIFVIVAFQKLEFRQWNIVIGNKQTESYNFSSLLPTDIWGHGIDPGLLDTELSMLASPGIYRVQVQVQDEEKYMEKELQKSTEGPLQVHNLADQHNCVRKQRLASETPERIRGNSVWRSYKAWTSACTLWLECKLPS